MFVFVAKCISVSVGQRQETLYGKVKVDKLRGKLATMETHCKRKLAEVHNAYRQMKMKCDQLQQQRDELKADNDELREKFSQKALYVYFCIQYYNTGRLSVKINIIKLYMDFCIVVLSLLDIAAMARDKWVPFSAERRGIFEIPCHLVSKCYKRTEVIDWAAVH